MAISADAGPLNIFGQAAVPPGSQSGVAQDYNPHRGPSLFDQGLGLADPRYPFSYQPGGTSAAAYGWLGTSRIPVLDTVPATKAVAAIAAAANVVAATPMTLVSVNGAGIVVGQSVTNALTGATVTGLLAIGQAGGAVSFGQSKGNNIWDPTKMLGRAVAITAAAAASGTVVFTVKGYDVYGYPMSEAITAAANTQTLGKKAFKYIASVTPATTDAQNYSVDTTDVIGLPLRADSWAYVDLYFGLASTPANNVITAATGFVLADVTNPATTTTGDVRGTYAMQTATDGAKTLTIFVSPKVANIGTYTVITAANYGGLYTGQWPSGLVGMPQI